MYPWKVARISWADDIVIGCIVDAQLEAEHSSYRYYKRQRSILCLATFESSRIHVKSQCRKALHMKIFAVASILLIVIYIVLLINVIMLSSQITSHGLLFVFQML